MCMVVLYHGPMRKPHPYDKLPPPTTPQYDYGEATPTKRMFMTVDHRIECEGDTRVRVLVLAGFIIVIFPIGVPLGLFILLYSNRREIMHRETRSGEDRLSYIGE